MKCRMSIMALGAIFIMASCKNKAEGDNKMDTTTTVNTTVNTNDAMTPVVTSIEISPAMRSTFEEKYPQASNVQWNYYRPSSAPMNTDMNWDWSGWQRMDTLDYVTTYNWQGTDYTSWYDDQGTWVGTMNTVSDHSSLPPTINDAIKKQYNGYSITSIKKENDKNRTAYEIMLDNNSGSSGKILIDENGKIMKKKIDMGDGKMKEKMNPKDNMNSQDTAR